VSEHPLTTPLTGPPGNSVDGGLSTVEVRWILPGPLDAAIAGWYRRFPAWTESREDAYLIHPVLRGLSVKLRAGRELEVKSCHGCPGILDAAGRARGEVSSGIQTWWSLGFEATGPAGLLRSMLQRTATLVFAQALPADVEFDMSHCQSYADWLSRRDSPAAG